MAAFPRPKRSRTVHFVGTSRKDLRSLPKGARAVFGYAPLLAESGMKHPDAKPLKGFSGAGVIEVVEDLEGDTYRAVYTVNLAPSSMFSTPSKRSRTSDQKRRRAISS